MSDRQQTMTRAPRKQFKGNLCTDIILSYLVKKSKHCIHIYISYKRVIPGTYYSTPS